MHLDLYVKTKTLLCSARERVTNEDGAVATEYGLLLVLIAIAIVFAACALGISIATVFNRGSSSLSSAS
jgi:Flp pilus assembly pilin Flp